MRKHFWLERTSKKRAQLLTRISQQLKTAWRSDKAGSDGFPLNTAYVVSDLMARLHNRRPSRRIRRLPIPKTPKRLGDVLNERLVRKVHEYLYEEPFGKALGQFYSTEGEQASEQIRETINVVLAVSRHGEEMLPKPRGNWLHRHLLEVAKAANLGNLTNREMAEFFDDLCPCGSKHSRETMKKFRQRRAA